MEFSKPDWALFRKKIALWQEAYMERLNQEYMDILSGQGNPSDKFWVLEKRINHDKKCHGVVIQLRKTCQMLQHNGRRNPSIFLLTQ